MYYYEIWVADGRFHGSTPLTYSFDKVLAPLSVVSVPLRNSLATGFVVSEVAKPSFSVKPIRAVLSPQPLPLHCLQLARWLKDYYLCSYGDALRQFAPSVASIKRAAKLTEADLAQSDLVFSEQLTSEQQAALRHIASSKSHTILLHGDTGSGKTRVYMELAKKTLSAGKSVIILTPEIALTAQLKRSAESFLPNKVYVLHSELSQSARKKIWFEILEAREPVTIIGPRSALFAPVKSLGLIVVDEAHEPAYKQEQTPRYHAVRVASQLGLITDSKVILGSATPSVTDYYLAKSHGALVRMRLQAASGRLAEVDARVIDLKTAALPFNKYLSKELVEALRVTKQSGNQSLIYFNRRGSARLILCDSCGWQFVCPHCDVPVIYHADEHKVRCHICGYHTVPPKSCPVCHNPDIVYTSIGTKTLVQMIESLIPEAKVQRFDSDSSSGERLNELYEQLRSGQIDILVGTQQVAKGLDLPNLKLVGIVSAETSLTLPDYTAEERTFQLLYQVIGRVGRHHKGSVIIQSFDPGSLIIKSAIERDYDSFYEHIIAERQAYRFPPFSYLLKLTCRRATEKGAQTAAANLKKQLLEASEPVEIIGPTASFYGRRANNYYYQLVVKAKDRKKLLSLASLVPASWSVDLDPSDLL